jgi:hypothetical protein
MRRWVMGEEGLRRLLEMKIKGTRMDADLGDLPVAPTREGGREGVWIELQFN